MQAQESLAGKLIYTARLCRTLRADLLLQLGIYAGQDMLLKALASEDGQTMSMLAAKLGVQPPTVSKMVARMESQGFVRRQGSQKDNRRNHVHITDTGSQLVDKIDQVWTQAEEIAFDRLSDKDAKRLKKLLKKVRTNLEGKAKSGNAGSPARANGETGARAEKQ